MPNINTRIQNKHDTSTNWGEDSSSFVPLNGEIISYSDLHKLKVGDGSTTVANLPFVDEQSVTWYNAPYQIGLSTPCTTLDIMNALPEQSVFMFAVEACTASITDAPVDYGLLFIYYRGGNRISVEFVRSLSTDQRRWIGEWTWDTEQQTFTEISWVPVVLDSPNYSYSQVVMDNTKYIVGSSLSSGADLNNCVPNDLYKIGTWFCNGSALSNEILNTPIENLNSTFYLTSFKTWANIAVEGQYRAVQVLYKVNAGDPQIYMRAVDRGGSVTSPWGNWRTIALDNGEYPNMTVGGANKLAAMTCGDTSTGNQNWYEICTITRTNSYASFSIILLLNGRTTGAQYSGIVELEGRGDPSGWTYRNLKILCGNLPEINIRYYEDGDTFHYYLYAPSTIYAITILSELYQSLETYEYPLTLLTASDIPEDAVNAINVNIPRPLFSAIQIQPKTPTINTEMTLDGGVYPPDVTLQIGDNVTFYCSGGGRWSCTGIVTSTSTTTTVKVTGITSYPWAVDDGEL